MRRILKHIFILCIITFVKVFGSAETTDDREDDLCTRSGVMCDGSDESASTFDMDITGVLILKPQPKVRVTFDSKMSYITSWIKKSVDSIPYDQLALIKHEYYMKRLPPPSVNRVSHGPFVNLEEIMFIGDPSEDPFADLEIKTAATIGGDPLDESLVSLDPVLVKRNPNLNKGIVRLPMLTPSKIISSWFDTYLEEFVSIRTIPNPNKRDSTLRVLNGFKPVPKPFDDPDRLELWLANLYYGVYFCESYNLPGLSLPANPIGLKELAENGGKEAQYRIAFDCAYGGNCFGPKLEELFKLAVIEKCPYAIEMIRTLHENKVLSLPENSKWAKVYDEWKNFFTSSILK